MVNRVVTFLKGEEVRIFDPEEEEIKEYKVKVEDIKVGETELRGVAIPLTSISYATYENATYEKRNAVDAVRMVVNIKLSTGEIVSIAFRCDNYTEFDKILWKWLWKIPIRFCLSGGLKIDGGAYIF